ncbi:MAG TPA: ABC transporter substrate-binding protein [Burkholderiales bacterium]|jgi:putative ABC transport system substrate-binding protein
MKTARRRLLALGLAPFAAPISTWAQPRKPWRIGYLAQADAAVGPDTLGQLRAGMKDLGYEEKRDYLLEVRNAKGSPERLDQFAAELAALRVDLIVASSTPPAVSALKATRSIPIVMAISGDPVGSGLIKSFARPGGNVTGTTLAFDEVNRKWLEMLIAIRPGLSHVGVVSNPANVSMRGMLDPLEASSRALSLKLTVHHLSPGEDAETLLGKLKRNPPEGLIVLPDAHIRTYVPQIAQGLARMRLPAVYGVAAYAEMGGLISYGPDQRAHYRRAAAYVEKILKGANPAEIPVEFPTRFEFVVNLKSAREAGLSIPHELLLRADKVIR